MKRILRRPQLAGIIIAAIAATSVTLAPRSFAYAQGPGRVYYNGFGQGYYGGYGRSYYGAYRQRYVGRSGTGRYGYSGYGSGVYGNGFSNGYVYPSVEGYAYGNGGYPYGTQLYARTYDPYGNVIYSPFGYGY